jgi:hypothetical protein
MGLSHVSGRTVLLEQHINTPMKRTIRMRCSNLGFFAAM